MDDARDGNQREDPESREGLEEAGSQRDAMDERVGAGRAETRTGHRDAGVPGDDPHATAVEAGPGGQGGTGTYELADADADSAPAMDRDAYHEEGGPAEAMEREATEGARASRRDSRRFVEAPPTEDLDQPRGKHTEK